MRIEVRGRGLEVGPALSSYAERRALFAFGRFSPRIEGVSVRLSDTNGPRGGIDKECRLTARLRPSGALCVAEQDADMYAAIDRASERMARAVARELARRRGPRPTLDGTGLV
jgi:ribosomal subunit interface protein